MYQDLRFVEKTRYRSHTFFHPQSAAQFVSDFTVARDCLSVPFQRLPSQAYAPVRHQLHEMLSDVNKKLKQDGYELLPWSCLRLTRRNVSVFVEGRKRRKAVATQDS